MKIVFTKSALGRVEEFSYTVNSVKFGKWLIAIDIVNVGWRSLMPEQYDSFTITNNDTE